MKSSLIYNNISIYRVVMNILYKGKYSQRFKDIINLLKKEDKKIVELCFGDTFIANSCKESSKDWVGFDISEYFVNRANKMSFNAIKTDVILYENYPKADVCIMVGSLYHFEKNLEEILTKMLAISPKIILSEPIINFSNSNNFFSLLSKKFTKSDNGEESFRFTKDTLLSSLNYYSKILNFSFNIEKENRDLLILIKK